MSLAAKAIKGFAWSAIGQWSGKAVSLLVFLALSRLLKPEDFGLVALASVFTAFVGIFHSEGFGQAVIQRADLESEHLDTAFWTGLTLACLLALGVWAGSGLAGRVFHEPRLALVISWLSLSLILEALSNTQASILRRNLAFKSLALRTLLSVSLGGGVGITLAYLGFGVWSLVAQTLAGSAAGIIVLWTASNWRPNLRFSWRHFRDLFAFGRNIIGIGVLSFLNRRSDDFLIGYFLGPTVLGYYTIAYKLLLTMTDLLTGVSSGVAFPLFSKIQQEPERLRRAFLTATRFTALVAFPAFIGVAMLAPELIVTVFGAKWAPSIPVMQILAFIGILHSVYYFNTSILLAKGKPGWSFKLSAMNAVSNVLAFSIAVHWGIVAVAAAYVIRGYVLSPIPLWLVHKVVHFKLGTYFRQYLPAAAASLAMAVVIAVLKSLIQLELGWQLLTLEVATGAITYSIVMLLVAPGYARQAFGYARILLPHSLGGRS